MDAAASAGPPLPGAESEAEARAFVQRVVAGSDGAEELARAARELSEGAVRCGAGARAERRCEGVEAILANRLSQGWQCPGPKGIYIVPAHAGAAGVVASVLGLPPGVDLPSWVGRVGAEGVRAARDGLSRMGLGEG